LRGQAEDVQKTPTTVFGLKRKEDPRSGSSLLSVMEGSARPLGLVRKNAARMNIALLAVFGPYSRSISHLNGGCASPRRTSPGLF
jgi:hypothetical protein